MLYLSESLQESVTECEDASSPPTECQAAAVSDSQVLHKEPICGASVDPVAVQFEGTAPEQQPTKPKKDKLARLKALGLDPPPVAKLCPDATFVELEPTQLNHGETRFLKDFRTIFGCSDFQYILSNLSSYSIRCGGTEVAVPPSRPAPRAAPGRADNAA